jgi:hypothetical protein
MPSQFSTIGFSIASGEDLAALASHVADKAERISTPPGDYLKWAPPSGEQLWLQISPEGDAMGMSAHFAGKSVIRVAVEARVKLPTHTPLDGTFLAWANPPELAATGGDYPFAFDCPDAATHLELMLPATLTAQVAAFCAAGDALRVGSRTCGVASGTGCHESVAVVHSLGTDLAGRRTGLAARAARAHRRARGRGRHARKRRKRRALRVGARGHPWRHVRRRDRSRVAAPDAPPR